MRTRLIAVMVLMALVALACGPADDDGGRAADDAGDAGDALELVAHLQDHDVAAVGQAVNRFGFDLLGELTDGTDSTIISPVSVATMLAMVLAGADGDTAAAMAEVLHLDDPRDVRVGALLAQLVDTDDVTVEVANGLWAGEGVPFEPDYLDFTTTTFDATLEQADLGAQATADDIDAWVREQTRDLIDGIAEDLGLPDAQVILVLLNAVYFLGEWSTRFDPAATRPVPFTLSDGSVVDVPMMHLADQRFGYAEAEGYRMVRLPYGDDGRYAMEVLLPDGDLTALLATLDAEGWAATVDGLQETAIDQLALPTFELEWGAELNDPLTGLGMGQVFGGDADLSPMSPAAENLEVVVHKTYIRVDEQGTEAAAVTGGAVRTSAAVDPLVFQVDRPFAFTISDAETGTILFLGTVTDPRG